jgi:trk/ktr system potassium uptake protein
MPTRSFAFSSGRTIIGSFILVVLIGTLLLNLPAAQHISVSFFDCLFTALSATCVTGLLTVPLSSFTIFGQCIILILMQIGGLGVITLSVFFVSLFAEVGLATQQLAEHALELSTWKDTRHLLRFIILLTTCMEIAGTLIIYFLLPHKGLYALFLALFHAVSSFCNVGLALFPSTAMMAPGSLIPFATNIPFLFITALLILVGGLGFITWYELIGYVTSLHSKRRFHFSLHSKLVFTMSFWLIVMSVLAILLLEQNNLALLTIPEQLTNAFFNAVSYRSTGFTTISMNFLTPAMLFFIMILSFIGSSPGSAGSGIKITTFALFLASVRAVIIGRSVVEIKSRKIPNEQLFKAMAVLSLALGWIAFVTFWLLVTHPHLPFLDLMFEAFSSFTNLGLSLGITSALSPIGKLLICTSMLVGRIGAITLLIALKRRREKREFTYPEERVIIG